MSERADVAHDRDQGAGAACCSANAQARSARVSTAAHGRCTFKVEGLDCAEEVAVLRRELGPLVGGADNLAFDVLNGRMTVLADAPPVSAKEIRRAVRRTGMTAVEWRPEEKVRVTIATGTAASNSGSQASAACSWRRVSSSTYGSRAASPMPLGFFPGMTESLSLCPR